MNKNKITHSKEKDRSEIRLKDMDSALQLQLSEAKDKVYQAIASLTRKLHPFNKRVGFLLPQDLVVPSNL